MAQPIRNRILRGGMANLMGLLVRALTQLVQVPVLLSAWPLQTASTWLLLWTLPSYMTLTVPAFSLAGGNLAVSAGKQGDIAQVRAAYRATRIVNTASNLILAAILLAVSPMIFRSGAWSGDAVTLFEALVLLALYVLVRVQTATLEVIFRYGEDYGGFGIFENVAAIGELAALAIIVNVSSDLRFLATGMLGVRLIMLGMVWMHAKARWPEAFRRAPPDATQDAIRQIWLPFLGFIMTPAVFVINLQGYSTLIAASFGPVILALFLTNRTLVRMLDQVCGVAFNMLFNEMSYSDAQRSRDTEIAVMGLSMAALAVISAGYIGALLLFGAAFQHLWTAGKIAFSTELVLILGSACIIRSLSIPPMALLAARNRHVPATSVYLISAVIGFAMAMLLAFMGLSYRWVAACIVVSEAAQTLIALQCAAQMYGLNPVQFLRQMTSGAARLLTRIAARSICR